MTRIEDFVASRTPPELYEAFLVPGFFKPWANKMVDLVTPGAHCLDLACGTGIISRTIAAQSPDAKIDAVDVAPLMLDAARKLAGSASVSFHQASADHLPFEDAVFDTAYCQQGLQFFPDRPAALQEIRRVLKPQGVFAAAVWRPVAEASPVFHAFEQVVAKHLGEDLTPLGPFAFGGQDKLRDLVTDAGFTIERLEALTLPTVLPSIEVLVLFDLLFLGCPGADGSMQPVLAPNDPKGDAIIAKMIGDLEGMLGEYVGDDGNLHAPTSTHFLVAKA